MCGFVGCLVAGDARLPDLDQWSTLIRHRGPDQSGSATERGFGIGTRRLSIQDLSPSGNQPMQSERYLLGFNGEIYNHLELRAELVAKGFDDFRSHSDTETILRAIECWGIQETLDRLNGMYALAIWDKAVEQLTLARDPLGIKPIYYLPREQSLYFSSELKALRPFTSGKVSQEGIGLYLYFGFVPAPYSLVTDVRKVKPGEIITFSADGKTYGQVVPKVWAEVPDQSEQISKHLEEVRRAVDGAVRRQMLSDVPVGLFLSGGVDSSVIAAVAATHKSGLASFSLRPDHIDADPGAQNDAEIAASLARLLGFDHHEVVLHPKALAEELATTLELVDEPVSELYFLGEIILSRHARSVGVPVVLTGHGGDEVFLGYPSYQAAIKGDRYNYIPFLQPFLTMIASSPFLSRTTRENLMGTASVWRKAPIERYGLMSATQFSVKQAATISGLSIDHLHNLVQDVLCTVFESVLRLPRGTEVSNAELFARMDLLLKVPDHYNMRLDKATMSASVEARVPLQDLELIGRVMHMPHTALLHGGLKGLLKAAFTDILPPAVLHRPKQTFQAPMLSWICGPMAAWVEEHISELSVSLPGARSITNSAPHSTKQAYCTWSLALLEAWRATLQLEY